MSSSTFIGIYRAIYDYAAQNEEELTVSENDLLYLLETSEVDDWWKVKKRVVGAEAEEPIGLVPSNYIETAPVLSTAVALYDYDKQTDEELSFGEGQIFNVYDTSDQDWILVGSNDNQFGFVPANYIEVGASATAAAGPVPSSSQLEYGSSKVAQSFVPPPQRAVDQQQAPPQVPLKDEIEEQQRFEPQPSTPAAPVLTQQMQYDEGYEDQEEVAPPMPSRPRPSATPDDGFDDEEDDQNPEQFVKDDFFTWPVHEIDSKGKKIKNTFGVGNATVYLSPDASTGASPKKWKVHNLLNFSNEKKHVFLEFEKPYANVELHAGSKDAAEAIVSILGDIKGAISMKGLQEVKAASVPSQANGHKTGRIIFDFDAATEDELTVKEGDLVYIINDKKSKDWWMVENIDSGEQGVIPSNYVELTKSMRRSSSSNLLSKVGARVANPNKKKRKEKEREKLRAEHAHREKELEKELERERRRTKRERELRTRDERDRIRRHDERERAKAEKATSASSSKEDKSKPNPHRVRTWIDRSGSFKVEAEFLGCVDGKIHLHKTNGVKIAVAAPKLSNEDLEYVERITGMSLDNYKQKAKSAKELEEPAAAPPQPARPASNNNVVEVKATPTGPAKDPDYDWFEFFLNCGVDVNNCQRYQLNFNREQMDENILEDITPSLLRTLGLREGDILRVMKYLDSKFDRKKEETNGGKDGLFQTSNGNLSTDRLVNESEKVDGSKLATNVNGSKPQPAFEDDAWAVKPAAKTASQTDLTADVPSRPSSVPTQNLTGSISDLINLKPIDPKAAPPAAQPPLSTNASAPALQPIKTGGNLASDSKSYTPLNPQMTSGTLGGQMTGGFLTAQPTGFVPIGNFIPTQMTGGFITAQPTGLIPLQATGGLVPLQRTGGLLLPLQRTGGAPIAMPQTSFGQQLTGALPPATSFGVPQLTGATSMPIQKTGGFVPQTSFGQMLVQKTGGNFAMPATSFGAQPTGQFNAQPTGGIVPVTNLGAQPTGSIPALQPQQTSFNGQQFQPQQTSFNNQFQPQQTSFNNQFQPQQTSFNNQFQPQQPLNTFGMNGLTNMFQSTSISPAPPMPQPSFGQFPTGFQQPQPTSFGGAQFPLQQQPTSFGNAGQFDQPLAAQPTGFGFGNSGGLAPQKTGRANLANATADNPFGF